MSWHAIIDLINIEVTAGCARSRACALSCRLPRCSESRDGIAGYRRRGAAMVAAGWYSPPRCWPGAGARATSHRQRWAAAAVTASDGAEERARRSSTRPTGRAGVGLRAWRSPRWLAVTAGERRRMVASRSRCSQQPHARRLRHNGDQQSQSTAEQQARRDGRMRRRWLGVEVAADFLINDGADPAAGDRGGHATGAVTLDTSAARRSRSSMPDLRARCCCSRRCRERSDHSINASCGHSPRASQPRHQSSSHGLSARPSLVARSRAATSYAVAGFATAQTAGGDRAGR